MKNDNSQNRHHIESLLRKIELKRLSTLTLINSDELMLLEWYTEKNEQWIEQARTEEEAHIQSQRCSPDGVNESGMIAIGYFERRLRFSHVIYVTSVLDALLETACSQLIKIRGSQNLPFKPDELRGRRYKAQIKFLKAYSRIDFPEILEQSIHQLHALRRIIVRNNGSLQRFQESEKLKWRQKFGQGLIINGDEISISRQHIERTVEAIRAVAKHIETGLRTLVDVSIQPKALK